MWNVFAEKFYRDAFLMDELKRSLCNIKKFIPVQQCRETATIAYMLCQDSGLFDSSEIRIWEWTARNWDKRIHIISHEWVDVWWKIVDMALPQAGEEFLPIMFVWWYHNSIDTSWFIYSQVEFLGASKMAGRGMTKIKTIDGWEAFPYQIAIKCKEQ